jgi:predicted permease
MVRTVIDGARQELRDVLRGLWRARAFTLSVIATLALGIGLNASMVDLVDRLMFRPLAYLRDAPTVHRLYWQRQQRGVTATSTSTQYAQYLDFLRSTTSFSQIAAFSERPLAVGTGEAARERRVGAVSASFFALFDAKPVLGRFFTADEDATPRGADVAVLSYEFWQSAFDRGPVLGSTLQVGNVNATIVGVAPPGFSGVNDSNPPAIYLPITTFAGSAGTNDAKTYFTRYHWGWVNVLVRRKPGVSVAQAQADATRVLHGIWTAVRTDDPSLPPLEEARPAVVVSSVRPGAGPDPALEARVAVWLASVAAIVLLIACANVANLLLTRAIARRRDTAVRLALGASRGRLILHAATESAVLSITSGLAALVAAAWAGAALRGVVSSAAPGATLPPIALADRRLLLVTLALTLVTAIATSLVPAFLANRSELSDTLRGAGRGGGADGARLRVALLTSQAALSVVLLVGALLFVRSLQSARSLPLGYDAEHVLLVSRTIRGVPLDETVHRTTRQVLESTARSIPQVASAAWVSSTPFLSTSSATLYAGDAAAGDPFPAVTFQATTPDYFQTMGTRILRGRGLSRDDRTGAPPVAIVSESMAARVWPGADPIGQCFRMRERTAPCTTVVGVAQDIVQRDLSGADRAHFYLSIDQHTRSWGNWLAVRTRGAAARDAETVRAALQRAMPGASYVTVYVLSDVVKDAQRPWRMGAAVFVALGGLALIVAAVGLYAAVGYNLSQRRHELAVRAALGARRADIVTLVVRQSVAVAAAGCVLGALAAVIAGGWIQPVLFRQSARDPIVYAVVSAIVIAVAIAASAVPALRAARIDPNSALRAE